MKIKKVAKNNKKNLTIIMIKYYKNKNWSDFYTAKAKKDGYPSRSIYKLIEIQKKYKFIKKGNKILDLGCFPGSWITYLSKKVGENGIVIGIDLKKVNIYVKNNVKIYNSSIFDFEFDKLNTRFDSILSDMSPKITGNKIVDNEKSMKLVKKAIKIAKHNLIKGGTFVCKIFYNNEITFLLKNIKKKFKKQILYKPKSSRKSSREIYLIGIYKF